MELIQLLEPTRNSSIADVIANVIGTGFGVMAGLLFETLASRGDPLTRTWTPGRTLADTPADRGALMLAFCWVAWLFFPLFPLISRFELSRKLGVFGHARLIDPVTLLSTAAGWYAGGLLSTTAGARFPRSWFALTLVAIPVQFFVVERQPLPSLVLGAIAGVFLFAVCHLSRTPTKVEAWAFLAVVLVRGLSPFHFAAESAHFNWIPFGATLLGDWHSAAGVLIEKVFYYGTAIWLLRGASLTLARSATLVVAALASIEIAQVHLPGRTPEITDPVLAVIMGFLLAMLSRPAHG
jgi:VanZ family protein